MNEFKFDMGADVRLVETGEHGKVIGRAQYAHSENGYLIRYRAADGRQTESWWGESALEA